MKDFDKWNTLKKKLDALNKIPFFNEREIWWCSVGINVGSEIFGKGETFSRPVLIIKKFSNHSFLGIPLTTKIKNSHGYYEFTFKGKNICAVLYDLKKMDARRLDDKKGKLSEGEFEILKEELKKMIFDPN